MSAINENKPSKVPLIEQLLSVPDELRISWEYIGEAHGGSYPFGYLCRQAAAELAALRSENETLKQQYAEAYTANCGLLEAAKQIRAENEKLRNTLCIDEHDRPSRLWKLFDDLSKLRAENERLTKAVEQIRDILIDIDYWADSDWERLVNLWLTAHPKEENAHSTNT